MKPRTRVLTVVGLCGLMSNLLHADVRQTLLELPPGIFNSRGGDTTRQMKAAAVFFSFLSFFFFWSLCARLPHPLLNAPFRRLTPDCQHITGSLNQAGTRKADGDTRPPLHRRHLRLCCCQHIARLSSVILDSYFRELGGWRVGGGDCVDNTLPFH